MLLGQLVTTKDRLKTVEMELETSQDRVSKLAAEVDDNNKNASLYAIDMDNMKLVCFYSCLSVNAGLVATAAQCLASFASQSISLHL